MSYPTEQSAYTLAKQITDLAASNPDNLYDKVVDLLEQWHEVVYKRGHEDGKIMGVRLQYLGLIPGRSTSEE